MVRTDCENMSLSVFFSPPGRRFKVSKPLPCAIDGGQGFLRDVVFRGARVVEATDDPRGQPAPGARAARTAARRWGRTLGLLALALVCASAVRAAESRWFDRFVDPTDGYVDLSEHLLTHRGLLPVPILVTEPALGYGGGLAALWFKESVADAAARGMADSGRRAPPAIGALAGFRTENGSSGGFAAYFAPLAGDRFRVLAAGGKMGLNLDYYDRRGRPAAYRLDGQGLLVQGLARAGATDWFVGARYAFIDTTSTFARERAAEVPARDLDVRIGRLSLIVDVDSRDNFFTPSSGTFAEAEFAAASEALGGSVDFRSIFLRVFHYVPVGAWVIGLRGDVRATSADTPFYAKPYVMLRGIPALRYQDDRTAVAEAELRWNVTARWAVLGFAGVGRAFGGRASWSEADTVDSRGLGARYLIARKLGLYAGIDIARGPEDRAVYVQVGSAWW